MLVGLNCGPEGLRRPSKHQQYPALEKVPTPCEKKTNTAGTSGHGSFSLLVEKEQKYNNIRGAEGYRPLMNSKTDGWSVEKMRRTVKCVGPFSLKRVYDCC